MWPVKCFHSGFFLAACHSGTTTRHNRHLHVFSQLKLLPLCRTHRKEMPMRARNALRDAINQGLGRLKCNGTRTSTTLLGEKVDYSNGRCSKTIRFINFHHVNLVSMAEIEET
eukprot:s126_g55.t1